MKQSLKKPLWIRCLLLSGGFGLIVLTTGCASIIHGSKQSISLSSSPTGAKVIIKNVHVATTPAVIKLDRQDTNIILRFEKEGYEPVEIPLNRSIDGWVAGNLIFGLWGVIGIAIDFATGSAYRLSPSEVHAVLQELKKQGMNIENLSKDNAVVIAVDQQNIK